MRGCLIALVTACATTTKPPTPPINVGVEPLHLPLAPGISAHELIEHPPQTGTEVTVDIYEPLYDSSHSTVPEPGELEAEVTDVGARRLVITATAGVKLPAAHSPIRVRGVVEPWDDQGSIRIRAREVVALQFPAPTRRATTSDLSVFDHYVEVEGVRNVGFEFSTLDDVWLDAYPDAVWTCVVTLVGKPRTRVTGYYYGFGRYGHMGASSKKLVATRVIALMASCPE